MPADKLKTMILRFRDMLDSDTIVAHKNIIENCGHVWWGWWAKPQEKVPINEFNRLRGASSKTGGLNIMLFDSGKKALYEACCVDIRYCNGDKISSPDISATPAYYASQNYMAWFQLSSISEAIPDSAANKALKPYSYYRVLDFFVSGHSDFEIFYNKRVYSVDELAEQQRTIWFVRNFEHGDKSHEIHSYSAGLNSGNNVDLDFKVLRTNSLLWISDLHFSQQHHAFNDIAGSNNELDIRLHSQLNNLGLHDGISAVIISGDLTYTAAPDEFAVATKFITKLNSMYSLDGRCYSICPGNHDLKLSESSFQEDEKVTVAPEKSKENYVEFYKKIFCIEPTESLYSIRRFLTKDLVPIEIISLNSCLLQQGEHFMGMGFAGNDQLADIEKDLALTADKRVIRILVMHHHLLPVMFSENPKVSTMYSMMLDSEAVSQFVIQNRIGLVLHGHTHKEYYTEIIRENKESKRQKFHVIGLGSTGAIAADLSENRANMFSVLTFSDEELRVTLYDIKPSGENSVQIKEFPISYKELINVNTNS